MSDEQKKAWQLAIGFPFDINDENTEKKYVDFRNKFERLKGNMYALSCSRMIGNYYESKYDFHMISEPEICGELVKRILESGLSQEVHIDPFPGN
jgi:hypothetical protein